MHLVDHVASLHLRLLQHHDSAGSRLAGRHDAARGGLAEPPLVPSPRTPPRMSPVLALAIPSPPERHDDLVRTRVAPVLRPWASATRHRLAWFVRANKPDWGLRLLASGDAHWLADEVRPAFAAAFDLAAGEAHFTEEAGHDKWTGGLDRADGLGEFLQADTRAALEALDADARGELGSRAQFSLVVVEGLLDAFGIAGERRLAFYRESFEWAIDLGRWDREVLASLERTFEKQRSVLAAAAGRTAAAWPSPVAARIGCALLAAIESWSRSPAGAEPGVALDASRGHSNRLGIHGGREASLRYLMWRTRGGRALEPA